MMQGYITTGTLIIKPQSARLTHDTEFLGYNYTQNLYPIFMMLS